MEFETRACEKPMGERLLMFQKDSSRELIRVNSHEKIKQMNVDTKNKH